MPLKTFEVFVIDPPWPQEKGGVRKTRPNQERSLDYQTMDVPKIFELLEQSVLPQTTENHCVFLWLIDKYLHEGELEMIRRGYKRHARFVWDKENGVAPAFTVRYSHEYLTWFYKPKLLPIEIKERGNFTTVIRAKGREHSRKPDEAYAMIDAIYPSLTKIDVFSREKRKGWEQFGNEVNKFTSKELKGDSL